VTLSIRIHRESILNVCITNFHLIYSATWQSFSFPLDSEQLRYHYKAKSICCKQLPPIITHQKREIIVAISPAKIISTIAYSPSGSSAQGSANLLLYSANSALRKVRLDIDFAGVESTREAKLRRNAFNTVGRVDVLDEGDLVAGSGSLTGDDRGVGKEVFPDLKRC
jgi:hypothetical protein